MIKFWSTLPVRGYTYIPNRSTSFMQIQNSSQPQPNNAGSVNVADNVHEGECRPLSGSVWGRRCGIITSVALGLLSGVNVIASVLDGFDKNPSYVEAKIGQNGSLVALGAGLSAIAAGGAVVACTTGTGFFLTAKICGGETSSLQPQALAPPTESEAHSASAGAVGQNESPPPYTKTDSSIV